MSLEAAARELDKLETRMKQGVNHVSACIALFSVKRMSQTSVFNGLTPTRLRKKRVTPAPSSAWIYPAGNVGSLCATAVNEKTRALLVSRCVVLVRSACFMTAYDKEI